MVECRCRFRVDVVESDNTKRNVSIEVLMPHEPIMHERLRYRGKYYRVVEFVFDIGSSTYFVDLLPENEVPLGSLKK